MNHQTALTYLPQVARGRMSIDLTRRVLAFLLVFPFVNTRATSEAPIAGKLRDASSPFVKIYANIIETGEQDISPAKVIATADGGFIALAQSFSTTAGDEWLLKCDATGHVTWQRQVGCFHGSGGFNASGVSIQQCVDGGYIISGGVLGCGANVGSGLIEKLDSQGNVVWASAYPVGALGTGINQIRQTTDGGYIAVGTAERADLYTIAVILKIDPNGNVQWQQQLGLTGQLHAYFTAVEQRSDGGYVALGETYLRGNPLPHDSITLVAFDPNGNLEWQQSYNNFDHHGAAINKEHALALTKTSDGGYLIGGDWVNDAETIFGPLLLKLDASGQIEWQQMYDTDGPGLVESVHETSDGGYVAAGDAWYNPTAQSVPWIARVDSNGNLLWQYVYFDLSPTGRPLSQYFASSCLTTDGGIMTIGWTENYSNGHIELYGVRTDAAGQIPGCNQVNTTDNSGTMNPQITALSSTLPIDSTITPGIRVSITKQRTSVAIRPKCRTE